MIKSEDIDLLLAVLDCPSTEFIELVRASKLDPSSDFRGADLCGVDFGSADLTGFDFRGADLMGANFAAVQGLQRSVLADANWDSNTRWPPYFHQENVSSNAQGTIPRIVASTTLTPNKSASSQLITVYQPLIAAHSNISSDIVVRLKLIGKMEARTITQENVLPTGRKTCALLAAVALSSPLPALRGRLAELLWSRRPEEQARAALRQEIHRLLEALSPARSEILVVTRDQLTLRPGAVWIDVEEVMRATTTQSASLSLLDGDLLEDLDGIDPTFDAWLNAERERLRDRARNVAEALLKEQLEPEATIPAAQRLLQIDRTHEGAWRALMRAHAARGERGMAIQAYDRCRVILADLLDAAPSPETQRLLNEIRGPSSSRLPQRRPPALPVQLEPEPESVFVEHDDPLAEEPEPRNEPRISRGGAHVGVMPMQLVGVNEEDARLAPGLAEEITTALSRFRWMFVVSSNSLVRFASETRDETAIRRMFGIDFLVDGTIYRMRSRLRITMRLLDLRAGSQVMWSRRFDCQSNDILSLQDEIAAEVGAQIESEILLIESRLTTAQPPVDASAYDLVLLAIPLIGRMEKARFMQAGAHLAKAIVLAPDYATAYAWYAYWHIFLVGQDWTNDPKALISEAGRLAERAVVLDPFDARALTIAGHVQAFLHRRLREATALHERALSLNPNLAMAWALSAATHAYAGDHDEAERRNNRYKKLSPTDQYSFLFDSFFILIYLLKHDYDSAVEVGRTVTEINPSFSDAYKPYLAALGYLGQQQEMTMVRQRLLMLEPNFTIQRFLDMAPLEKEADRSHYAEGLRLAGVPIGRRMMTDDYAAGIL